MERVNAAEILDGDGLPDELVKRVYRDLARIHWWLGDTHFVIRAIREDPMPVRRILDVGCGIGSVMENIRDKLGVEAVGVDVKLRIIHYFSCSHISGRCNPGSAPLRGRGVLHAPGPPPLGRRPSGPDPQRGQVLPPLYPSGPGAAPFTSRSVSTLRSALCVPNRGGRWPKIDPAFIYTG